MATIVSEALIAQRAYAIWEKQGRPHGRDREHWSQACEELNGRAVVSGKKVRKAPRAMVAESAPKSPAKGKSK
jgi:hypothetical protein